MQNYFNILYIQYKKTDCDGKFKNLNIKTASDKTKHLLVENELKKLQIFDSSLGLVIG